MLEPAEVGDVAVLELASDGGAPVSLLSSRCRRGMPNLRRSEERRFLPSAGGSRWLPPAALASGSASTDSVLCGEDGEKCNTSELFSGSVSSCGLATLTDVELTVAKPCSATDSDCWSSATTMPVRPAISSGRSAVDSSASLEALWRCKCGWRCFFSTLASSLSAGSRRWCFLDFSFLCLSFLSSSRRTACEVGSWPRGKDSDADTERGATTTLSSLARRASPRWSSTEALLLGPLPTTSLPVAGAEPLPIRLPLADGTPCVSPEGGACARRTMESAKPCRLSGWSGTGAMDLRRNTRTTWSSSRKADSRYLRLFFNKLKNMNKKKKLKSKNKYIK